MPKLRNGSKGGFEPGLSRLRVRRSTAELPMVTLNHFSLTVLCFGHLMVTQDRFLRAIFGPSSC